MPSWPFFSDPTKAGIFRKIHRTGSLKEFQNAFFAYQKSRFPSGKRLETSSLLKYFTAMPVAPGFDGGVFYGINDAMKSSGNIPDAPGGPLMGNHP